jgi:2-phospho-L-lactate guanylyltransferase (CobY/MobA/RfbA family)
MGDLPHVDVDDVRAIATTLLRVDVVIAPDLRDEGTNALGARVGAMPRTCFGHGDSFARHLEASRNLRVAVHRSAGLGFDVDTQRDWERLAPPHSAARSTRNRTRSSRVSDR